MQFIYHIASEDIVGETLTPRGDPNNARPTLYTEEIERTDDSLPRDPLAKRIVKKLNCSPEEVLNFSPIHPHLIFQALRSVFPQWKNGSRYYEIPVERMQGLPAVIFNMNRAGLDNLGDDEPEEIFEWVTPESYRILEMVPLEAIEYYNKWKARGERGAPAMAKIPLLMVRGCVSIAGCEIIDWEDKPRSISSGDRKSLR